MSLIGVDVGSSAVKAAAYRSDAMALASRRIGVASRHAAPGQWEVDPAEVWEAGAATIAAVARDEALRDDPPEAIAISASGREIFPADAHGDSLGPCLMAADARCASATGELREEARPERWVELCGHVPERMDPLMRIVWWHEAEPDVARRASLFIGWHELLTLKLSGRAVTDPGLAGRWLAFDPAALDWSRVWLERFELQRERLPEIRPWGDRAGTVSEEVARSLGVPAGLPVAVGGFDASCAALGSGVTEAGTLGLACGSWHAGVLPLESEPEPGAVVAAEASLGPHPGTSGHALFRLSPNGGAVIAWGERLFGAVMAELEGSFTAEPSPVIAVPRLSETEAASAEASGAAPGGALTGLSLATGSADALQGLAEGTAYELTLAVRGLREAGVEIEAIRATGGGSRSTWWLQLVADLSSIPVDVARPDAGTLGAAMLAGIAVGEYESLADAAALVEIEGRHEPDPGRSALHAGRLDTYASTAARVGQIAIEGGGRG